MSSIDTPFAIFFCQKVTRDTVMTVDAAEEMQIDELCVINQQMRTEVDWTGPLAPHPQCRV
jgi:hypothetical protein